MEIENSPAIIADFELNSAATLFKDAVKKLELANDKQTKNRIIFSLNKKLKYEEYILEINSDKIVIEASSKNGAIYGFQSLNQLMNLNLNSGVIKLQNQVIKDSPRFKYRGMHLDVGRPVSYTHLTLPTTPYV